TTNGGAAALGGYLTLSCATFGCTRPTVRSFVDRGIVRGCAGRVQLFQAGLARSLLGGQVYEVHYILWFWCFDCVACWVLPAMQDEGDLQFLVLSSVEHGMLLYREATQAGCKLASVGAHVWLFC